MSTPTHQIALAVTQVGKPITAIRRRVPAPKPNEVLVKITATHLLPHDAYGRDFGLFIETRLPFVLGSDLAGTIVSLGSPDLPFKVGDHVFGIENLGVPEPDQAGLQEYALLEADAIAKIPEGVRTEEAVTLPINLVTAFLTLFSDQFGMGFAAPWEKGFDFKSKTIVVLAAGSNLGKLAIQLAKIAGVGQVIAVAGKANAAELEKLGATHFIDRHVSDAELKQQIDAILGGPDKVQYILDCYNWTWELAESLISKSQPARIVVVHTIKEPGAIEKRNPNVKCIFVLCGNANLQPHAEEFWKRLPSWIQEGKISPAPYRVIEGLSKVDEINKALDEYAEAKGGPQAVVVM